MVIRDFDDIQTAPESPTLEKVQEKLPAMAAPLDRIAAIVIDYFIVLLPFMYLVLAPFQRSMKEAAIIDDQWQMSFSILLGGIAVITLVFFYQVTCVWLWGATLGKAFMGLRVRSIWVGEKVSLSHAASRALYWWLSWLFFGVPFLATFSNLMRRPLHDRISDTVVVSTRAEKSVQKPSRKETSMVRGLYWAFSACAILVLCSLFVAKLSQWQKNTDLISSLESEDVLCPAVSDAHAEWPLDDKGEEFERLPVAMTLYAAGAIDLKCLEGEVESLHASGDDTLTLNLARSFVYAAHPDRSDMYLEKICKVSVDSDECQFSKIISAAAMDEWENVANEFDMLANRIKENKSEGQYMAVWGVRQFIKREDYKRAGIFMEFVPEVRALSDFYLPAKTKILWGLKKTEEATGIESVAYASISDEAKLDLASYLCFEQIWSTCELKNSNSCRQVNRLADVYDDSLSTIRASLAYLRKWECDASSTPEYDKLYSKSINPEVRALVLSLGSEGTEGFNEILSDPSVDTDLAGEVTRRLVERTASKGLLKTIHAEWEDARHTLAWQKLGESLFNKYFERREYLESLSVVEALISSGESASRLVLEHAVLAAARTGQMDRAKKIFIKYAKANPLPNFSASRMPASDPDEFLQIVTQFIKDGL